MNGSFSSIEIETVERQVCNYPFGDLMHVFVVDDEITSCAAARTHKCSSWSAFAGCMLIELWRNPASYIACSVLL